MDAAWDRKDLTAWAALFDHDATIQAGPNAVIEGQAAIRAFFGRDFHNRRGAMRHQRTARSRPRRTVRPKVAVSVSSASRAWSCEADARSAEWMSVTAPKET